MKRPSCFVRRGNDTDLNATMTPMIDVVFLLLVFFVWTASFQIIEQILPSQMSAQLGSEASELTDPIPEDDFDDVVIRIGWDGQSPQWSLNDQPMEGLEQVQAQLQIIAGVKQDAPVILHPDSNVPLGHVINGYDAAKVSGFAQISFAVNPANP